MNRSKFAAALLIMAIMLSGRPTYADTAQVSTNSVNINVNGVNVAVRGEVFVLQDENEVPFSIMYQGTTYLPIRKVCEFLGKDVAWDSKTRTAAITNTKTKIDTVATTKRAEVGKAQDLDMVLNSINISINDQMMIEAGETYTLTGGAKVPFSLVYEGTTYLPMRKMCDIVGKDITWDDKAKTVGILDIAELKMYKEFPGVPDFEQFAGKTEGTLVYKDGILIDTYVVMDEIKLSMGKYLGILFDLGYRYKESVEDKAGELTLCSKIYLSANDKNIVTITIAEGKENTYVSFAAAAVK